MFYKRKNLLIVLACIMILFSLSFTCLASAEEKSADSGITAISYRGDTALYPENSLEAVLSVWEKGADGVSVGVNKTSDGIYVLTENKKLSSVTDAPYESVSEITYDELQKYYLYDNTGVLTKYRMVSLSQVINMTEDDFYLILDVDWAERDGIYDLISHYDAFDRVIIRTKESAKTICEWAKTKDKKVNVIGVYDGNIIFNAISHFNILSDMQMKFIQFQSKNYFNIMYGNFFCGRFVHEGAPKAIVPMYDKDLSGQRRDSQEGWNDVLNLGYCVIETNNIVSLVAYKDRCEKMRKALSALVEREENADIASASSVTLKNRVDAINVAKIVLSSDVSSLDEIESAYSSLLLAMNENNIDVEEDTKKGQLNITAGKVIAVVLVGGALFAAQIFVHKMQEEKKRK